MIRSIRQHRRISNRELNVKFMVRFFLAFCLGTSHDLHAQTLCRSDEYRSMHYMGMGIREWIGEQAYQEEMQTGKAEFRANDVLYLPVVFHIVLPENGSIPAPDSVDIARQLERINAALRGEALCSSDPPGTDTRIQLCMAQRTPQGSPTTAVMSYRHALSEIDLCLQDLSLKTMVNTSFDPAYHINVYVVERICGSCTGDACDIGGYASYAPDHGQVTDGIVIKRDLILSDDCQDLKVFLHELGHYANLYHTFQQGCKNDDCLEDGDRVCDTPPSRDAYGLPSHPCLSGDGVNSCQTDTNPSDPNNPFSTDQADPSDNFMSYAPLSCVHRFTEGQAARMYSAISNLRSGLLQSRACEPPCLQPIVWDIALPDTIYAGEPFTPTNRTNGATDFRWILENKTYTGTSPTMIADSSGTYQLLILPMGLSAHCTDTLILSIEVQCRIPEILYTLSDTQIEHGEEISFQLIAPDLDIQYTWMVNDLPYSAAHEVLWSSDIEGSYTVFVLACNAHCCVRSAATFVQLGACQRDTPGKVWLVGSTNRLKFEYDGQLLVTPSEHRSYECMAIAYGDQGEFLFGSEGTDIHNRDMVFMQNGRGLRGHTSASQALTLRQPGSSHIWYLFTPHGYENINEDVREFPLHYAIIDMRLDGGRGAVVAKRQLLFRGSTEKITAVRHCNGADWWIITHEAANDRFRIYTLNAQGLQPEPIVQSIGYYYETSPLCVAGYFRPSPDGRYIASTKCPSDRLSYDAVLELFQFDPKAGLLSDPLLIEDSLRILYGVEFSSNGEYLYYSDDDKVYQVRVLPYHIDSIKASRRYMGSTLQAQTGAFCRGPDDVIYIAKNDTYLSAILHADTDSARLVTHYVIAPGTQRFSVGLPNFPNDLYRDYRFRISGPAEVCDTVRGVRFDVTHWCTPVDYFVEIGEEISLLSQDTSGFELHFDSVGDYTFYVRRETGCRTIYDTLSIQVLPCDSSCPVLLDLVAGDTLICQGQTAYVQLSSNAAQLYIQSDTDPDPRLISAGVIPLGRLDTDVCYTVRAAAPQGCDTTLQFCVKVQPRMEVELLSADTLICHGEYATIDLLSDADWVEIVAEDKQYSYVNPVFPFRMGPFYADSCYTIYAIDTLKGCDTLIQVCIRVHPVPQNLDLRLQDTVCGDSAIFSLDFDPLDMRYQWIKASDGSLIAEDFTLPWTWSEAGEYILRLLDAGGRCATERLVQARRLPYPRYDWVDLPERICTGDSLIARLDTDASRVYRLDDGEEKVIVPDNMQWPLLWSDTCMQFRLYAFSLCRLDIDICIDVDTQGLSILPPVTMCPGDSMLVFDTYVRQPGIYTRTTTRDQDCDLREVQEVRLHPEISYQVLSRPACQGSADGWIEIQPEAGSMPFDILWEHNTSTSMLIDGISEGLYSFTISDVYGCTLSGSVSLTEHPMHIPEIILQDPGCNDPSSGRILLNNTSPAQQYSINQRPYQPATTYTAGIYQLHISDSLGCTLDTMLELHIASPPTLQMPPDMTLSKGAEIILDPVVHGQGTYTYLWSPPSGLSCMTCPNPVLTALQSMQYTLQVSSDSDCQVSGSMQVEVTEPSDGIFIPTAFSPNGDGINDVFEVYFESSGFELRSMQLYDRWGNEVYRCDTGQCAWDGSYRSIKLNTGVFTYVIIIRLPSGDIIKRIGEVALMK
jgi:gliding motility-associated-like protein